MIRLTTCFALLFGATALGADISERLQSGEFWEQTSQQAIIGMRHTRPDAEHVRLQSVTIGELTTGETIVTLKDDQPVMMQAMLYNKGDDGAIDEESFNEKVAQARAAMDEMTGVKGKMRSVGRRDAAVKLKAWEWKWENGIARLEINASGKKKKFAAEFLRLNIACNAKTLSSGSASDSISKAELRENIVTEDDGTVWLKNVPMVDQGQKGYCAPATLARVFAFYGMDQVDQHSLADLCASQGNGGTSTRDIEAAMKLICKSYRTKFIVLEDYAAAITSFESAYNKLAKRKKMEPLSHNDPLGTADAKLLLECRAGKPNQVNKWLRDIQKHIDAGSPVVWGVTVGIFPEEVSLPQSRGGHLRLIIGYNLKEKTIIFSDSWGAAHARKTMDADKALSITSGRYVIKLR